MVGRSGGVVVTAGVRRRDGLRATVFRACRRSIGRDPELDVIHHVGEYSDGFDRLLFAGRFVAMITTYSDKYGNYDRSVSLADVVRGRRLAQHVSTSGSQTTGEVPLAELILGQAGHVAWIEGRERDRLGAIVNGRLSRIALEDGAPFAALRLEDDVLHWTANGEARRDVRRADQTELRQVREPVSATVTVHDLLARRRVTNAVPAGAPGERGRPVETTIGPEGHVALTLAGDGGAGPMRLAVLAGADRATIAEGRWIGAPRVDGSTVSWMQDGLSRSAPLP